ncbi:MAG: ATP-binding protein [Candidatus Competibacterales bacterium]
MELANPAPSPSLIDQLVDHVERAHRAVGCDNACIHLLSQDRRRLICQAISSGLRATHLAYGLDISACLAASEVLTTHEPLAIDDAVNDPWVVAVARRRFGLQSITYCPILVDGDPRGMMTFSYTRHHRWNEHQVKTAQTMADACGELLKASYPLPTQPATPQEGLLRAMLDATPGIVLAVDRHLLTLEANATLVAGADQPDGGAPLARLSIQELIQSTDRDYDLRQAIDDILSGELGRYEALVQIQGRYWNLILQPLAHLGKETSLVAVEATAVPGLVLSGADITPVMQARSVMEANQHMTALGRLSASVSHEFNNLLQILQGQVDQLQEEDSPERYPGRTLDALRDTVGRGAKLARQLLTFARPEDAAIQPLALTQRLAEWWSLLQNATGRDRRLNLQIRHPVAVMADPDQLELALVNLIINARDATQPGDTIELHVDRLEEAGLAYGTLAVVDHGEGMLPQILARATEPFFTTKPQGKGTGLGLPTVQRIAEAAGGRLLIQSEVGRGTAVTLLLPVAKQERPAVQAAKPPTQEYAALAHQGGQGHIVAVDDEQAICGWVKRSLEAAGHQVKTALSGAAFAELMAQDPHWPEVILLDMTLQDTTGLALFRRFRPHHPTLGWIIVSGNAGNADIEAIAQEGFEVLTKPFDGAQLRLAIERALAAQRRPREAVSCP